MSIKDHVSHELELLLQKPGADELTKQYAEAITEAHEAFQKHGMYEHGLIVNSALHMFSRLLNWLPISEIHSFQENPDEWQLVEEGDNPCYQNRRCSKVFFYARTGEYCDVNRAVFHDNICEDVGFTATHLRSEYVEKFKTEIEALGLWPVNSAQTVEMPYYPPDKSSHYYRDWYQIAFIDALDTFGDLITHRKKPKGHPNSAKNIVSLIMGEMFPNNDGKIFIGSVNAKLMATKKDELFVLIDLIPIDDSIDVIPIVFRFDSVDREGDKFENEIVPYFIKTIKALFQEVMVGDGTQNIFVVPIEDVEGARELPVLLPIHDSENMFNAVNYFVQVGFEHNVIVNMRGIEHLVVLDAHDMDELKERYRSLNELPVLQQSAAEKRAIEYLMDRRSAQLERDAVRAASGDPYAIEATDIPIPGAISE